MTKFNKEVEDAYVVAFGSYKLLDEETRYFSAEKNRRLEQLTFFSKILL